MSYTKKNSLFARICSTRSVKGFAQNFLLRSMAGQKLFLHNERIPRVVNISFNEKTCMYSCKMCPYSEDDVRAHYKKASEMDFATLERLVASIPNDPYYSFDISAIGETLEFSQLTESIQYMKKMKPLVNTIISTNAVLLTPEKSKKLFASGLDSIQFSLYAENAADHEYITGTKTFDRVCKNILAASEIRAASGKDKPFMQAFMIQCRENSHTSQQFLDFWSQHVDQAFLRPMYNVGRKIEGMTPLHEEADNTKRYPCVMPYYATAIRSDGDVLPCYMYHWNEQGWGTVVGNLNDMLLENIWETPAFQDFRKAHLDLDLKDYPICERCNLWNAYTNIWSQKDDGSFFYDGVEFSDLLRSSGEHRGG